MFWQVVDIFSWVINLFIRFWPKSLMVVIGFLFSLLLARLVDTPMTRAMLAQFGLPMPLAVLAYYVIFVTLGTLFAAGSIQPNDKPVDKP